MPHARPLTRTARAALVLAAHLTAHLIWSITMTVRLQRRQRQPITARGLTRMCRYYLRDTFGRREYPPPGIAGQPAAPLPPPRPATVTTARAAAPGTSPRDLRRRHVAMLLRALGDDPHAVEAALTRAWERDPCRFGCRVLEDYLAHRLAWRETIPSVYIEASPWAVNVGGVWAPVPAPVRAYLRHHAIDHAARLDEQAEPTPRRAPRHASQQHPTTPAPAVAPSAPAAPLPPPPTA